MSYNKTQTGWLIIGLMSSIIFLIILMYIFQWGNEPIPLLAFAGLLTLFILLLFLFYQLTVRLDGPILHVIYGLGIIHYRFTIDELESAKKIKTPWYYGFGIRITPKGMLYNISGPKAVEIKFTRNGKNKTILVGSPDPDRLKQALETTFTRRTKRTPTK